MYKNHPGQKYYEKVINNRHIVHLSILEEQNKRKINSIWDRTQYISTTNYIIQ